MVDFLLYQNSLYLLKKMCMLLGSYLCNLYQNSWYLLKRMSMFSRRLRSYLDNRKEVEEEEEEEDNRDQFQCWEQLPSDIWEKIVKQSNLADCVRMSVVCKRWNLIVKESNRAQVAWLALNHDRKNRKSLRFFDPCEGRFYDFKLPKNLQGGYWCCGSSKGWLVVVVKAKLNPKIFLYNPISGIQLPLPPLTTIPSLKSFQNSLQNFNNVGEFITKVELSSADATKNSTVVAAMFHPDDTLALCRPGDKRWTILEGIWQDDYDYASDILFYNGELHVLTLAKAAFATHTTPHIIRVGNDHDHNVLVKFIPNNCMSVFENSETSWDREDESGSIFIAKEATIESYLVESDGQLLIVHKTNNILKTFLTDGDDDDDDDDDDDNGPQFNYFQADRFLVFKTNLPGTMTRLNSLGDRMLFMTKSGSLSVPAGDFNGVKRNCIFFLSNLDYTFENDFDPYVSRESGVFSLEDRRIQRIFPSTKDSIHCRMNWFSPNIRL